MYISKSVRIIAVAVAMTAAVALDGCVSWSCTVGNNQQKSQIIQEQLAPDSPGLVTAAIVSTFTADGMTLADIQGFDFGQMSTSVVPQDAQLSSSSGNTTLSLMNGSNVVAQHTFAYTVSGQSLIPADPSAIQSWVESYTGQFTGVQGESDVSMTPDPGATTVNVTTKVIHSGTILASAQFSLNVHPHCPPIAPHCQPQ